MPKTKKTSKTKSKKPVKSAKKDVFTAKLTWLPKKTFELEFSIAWNKVKKQYQKTLKQLAKDAEIKGFRKGQAPLNVIEQNTDKSKLYGQVVNQLLPQSYTQAIVQHQLKPAISPKIQIIKAEENQPWQFKATACELPQVKLGDYKKTVKGILAKEKIWTPAKGSPTKIDKQKQENSTQKMNLIIQALLKSTSVELADILIDSEKDKMLSKLLQEAQKLGLTIDQYAQSINKTVDQLKQDYYQSAQKTLKMELILQAIADDRKLEIDKKEVDDMINTTKDEALKQKLNSPSERAYITSVIRKRKTIDYLLSL